MSSMMKFVLLLAALSARLTVSDAVQGKFPRKVIGLTVICDYSCSEAIKKWYPQQVDYISTVTKLASMRLANTSVNVVIDDLQIWNMQNEINVTTDADELLNVLSDYRVNVLIPQRWSDALLFITALQISTQSSDPSGKYYLKGICSRKHAVGFVRYESQSENSFATTLAHELGHGLGMLHDTDGCCPELGFDNCVMSPIQNSYQLQQSVFGSCSEEYYQAFLDHPRSWCIGDNPKHFVSLVSGDTCGNGIIDENEDCDCGQGCLDGCCNCCDEQTCLFKAGAQCASGPCCNVISCQFQPSSKICRPKNNTECDLDDTCSGVDTQCTDIYKASGLDCVTDGDKDGYCYKGLCRNRDSQCKRAYLDPINYSEAAQKCYDASISPSKYSHCGILSDGSFRACSGDYYRMCGTLLCSTPSLYNSYFATTERRMKLRFPYHIGYDIKCFNGFHGDWELEEGPLYVEDGTKCGYQKVCYQKQCIDKDAAYGLMEADTGPEEEPRLCGNGVVDAGETCDCGVFQCECCDTETCQLREAGSPCRYTGGCDMTCDGQSTTCQPGKINDFTSCLTPISRATGHCFDGACASRDGACMHAFGSQARAVLIDGTNREVDEHYNAGGFKLYSYSLNDWHDDEEYIDFHQQDASCGILTCLTTNDANINDIKTTTLDVAGATGTKVFYYTTTTVYKNGEKYERYYPALVDQGTACSINGQSGYCNTANLKISQSRWNWYWYAKCLPINGTLHYSQSQWHF